MSFRRRKAPHEVLIDPENEKVLGSLTADAWRKFSVLTARSNFYNLNNDPLSLKHPMEGLIEEARQTSGSIGGEHRKDITEALKAASPPPPIGLSLSGPPEGVPAKQTGL